jgi:hypothetical protein
MQRDSKQARNELVEELRERYKRARAERRRAGYSKSSGRYPVTTENMPSGSRKRVCQRWHKQAPPKWLYR